MLKDPIPLLSEEDIPLYEKITKTRGELRSFYRYLFHHPTLMQKISDLGFQLRFESTLPDDTRQFITLIIAAKYQNKRTFETHSKDSLLPKKLLDKLWKSQPIESSPWKEIFEGIQCYLQGKEIPKEILSFFIKNFGEKGLCEVLMLAGFYQMIILGAKGLNLPVSISIKNPLPSRYGS